MQTDSSEGGPGVTPLSILDLAPIPEGADAATALRNTIDLARHAESWGYHRYWVAEHHFAAVASSAPAVLVGQIAAATARIRVGAGAAQLGHTTAAAVVESFGIVEALHPGRIDLGLGRTGQRRREVTGAPSTAAQPAAPSPAQPARPREWHDVDGVVVPAPYDARAQFTDPRFAARQSLLTLPGADVPEFGDQVDDVLAMLAGTFAVEGIATQVVPGGRSTLAPWVFGSSKGRSAEVAGERGLPFVASYHITPATALDAVEAYRAAFVPSERLDAPYVVVSADVLAADDEATARRLASTFGHWVNSIRTGGGAMPYPEPGAHPPLTAEQEAVAADRTATQFVGNPDQVVERLAALRRVTGADELVITSVAHGHADRLRSHELIAARWGLG